MIKWIFVYLRMKKTTTVNTEYWDDNIKDITDEDVEHEKPDEVYE